MPEKKDKAKKQSTTESGVEEISNRILDVLANLSATDSWHDFHQDITGFKDVIESNKEIYCEGLPLGVTTLGKFNDEGRALSSVVKTKEGAPIYDFGESLVRNNTGAYGAEQPEYTINTLNNIDYSVKPLVVASGSSRGEEGKAGKLYLSAKDFTDKLSLENDSAIVIDATAVSILTILKNGPTVMEEGNRKKIYYVLTPEVVNDPAGKTAVSDKIFDPLSAGYKNGVELIACEPNVPESINYSYSYDRHINTGDLLKSESTNPYDKFFSSFNFQLSEVQRNRKGKKTEYTTNLVIKSNDARITVPENVQDSKTKNNITFLTSLLLGAIKLLGGKSDTLKNKFLFNTKLQQKRSGDWLQVLACLILRSRKLKQYNPPGTAPREQEIEKKISKIYFVTHDRVALSFALLLGVDCIYTHTATKSCYIFKIMSPGAADAANRRFLENKGRELNEILRKIGDSLAYYNSIQVNQIAVYNQFREQNITAKYPEQIRQIREKFQDVFSPDQPFNTTNFTKFTCETFELCLLFDYLLLNFPDLSERGEVSEGLVPKIAGLQSQTVELLARIAPLIAPGAEPPSAEIFDALKPQINAAISEYTSIMGTISLLETSLNKYTTNTSPITLKVNIGTTITNFQKTPNRKLASGWSWDNTQGNSRMWEVFKDLIGSTAYKSDKNIFLYNLTLLPSDVKNYLCNVYLSVQRRITSQSVMPILENVGKTPREITSEPRLTKFKVVTQGFIAEIFLNFGFTIPSSYDEVFYDAVIEETLTSPTITVSDSLTGLPVAVDAFSEDEIISENSQATAINKRLENFPENLIKELAILNYATEVDPNPALDLGRPVEDSKEVSKVAEELEKKLEEVVENVNSAKEDIKEAPMVDDDEEFTRIKNEAINQAIEAPVSPRSGSPTPIDSLQSLEERVKRDIVKDSVDDVEDSKRQQAEIEGELANPTDPTTIDSDKVRMPIDPAALIDNSNIPIRNAPKLLGADFETNIKDATYVLLNAMLDYKGNPKQLSVLIRNIKRKLDKFHEDYTESLGEGTGFPPSPPSRGKTIGSDSLLSLPRPAKRMFGGDGSSLALDAFFKDLNLSQSEGDQEGNSGELLKDANYLFHPLLPIYMIAESLHEITCNDNIDESLDYELYQKYLKFLETMRDVLVEEYKSKETIDVAAAFAIGVCLREFLFYLDVYSIKTMDQKGGREAVQQPRMFDVFQESKGKYFGDNEDLVDVGKGKSQPQESEPQPNFEFEVDQVPITDETLNSTMGTLYCESELGMSTEEFLPVSLLTGVFNYFISGIKTRSQAEIELGEKMLKSELFLNFIKKVNVAAIFRESIEIPEPIDAFKRKCFVFLLETGNIIISDRGGSAVEIPSLEPPMKELGGSGSGSRKRRMKKHRSTVKLNRKAKRRSTKVVRNKKKKLTRRR